MFTEKLTKCFTFAIEIYVNWQGRAKPCLYFSGLNKCKVKPDLRWIIFQFNNIPLRKSDCPNY